MALGLAAAHERGLIHRDVKPANILLEAGPEPRAKLTDFGLARAADDASLTQSGVLAGTPMYMAPEQVKGDVLDHRADLFGLGSVVYTMAAGRPPFRAATSFAVMKRVAEDAPRPLREVIGTVPPGLEAVIARLHAKRPEDRYATAREAADALEKCLVAPAAPVPARPATRRRAFAAAGLLLLVGVGAWAAAGFPAPRAGDRPADPGPAATADPPVPAPTPPAAPAPRPAPAFPPGTIVVTSAADDDTPGTLRWAVTQANVTHGEDRIVFDPAVFDKPTTITLTRGPLECADPARTTVTGPPAGLTVSGGGKSRVVTVGAETQPAAARLLDLTIAHGRAVDTGRERSSLGGGCLLLTGSALELVGCTIRDNHAYSGGGVFNYNGTLTLVNCTFTRNVAESEGGGAKTYGGSAASTIVNCTFVGNAGSLGGGHMCHGGARATAWNCLFADNRGGCLVDGDGRTAGGSNLFDDGSTDGDGGELGARTVNPRVGPLGRYGGPTETVPLLTGSPAVDAGDNDRVPAGVRTDQRGRPRIAGGRVDVGAVEAK